MLSLNIACMRFLFLNNQSEPLKPHILLISPAFALTCTEIKGKKKCTSRLFCSFLQKESLACYLPGQLLQVLLAYVGLQKEII